METLFLYSHPLYRAELDTLIAHGQKLLVSTPRDLLDFAVQNWRIGAVPKQGAATEDPAATDGAAP